MGKDMRIAVRVTVREKEKIQAKARKCGLSTTGVRAESGSA